ncbi:beta-carotene ketolase [Myxacorys almedinensis A]|uniref:Beta-carotene ketolase n=2 Tax=Myxacorys TaxID=2056239 RepID=A0A8J8CHC4_9CYAN|nr:beta-carotene ketolase [Myxacorys almedinensis A]
MQEVSDQGDKGVVISTSIFGAWAITLSVLLRIDISALPIAARVALVALQTFLYTGLFINAHDAMHGAIAPKNPKLNRLIGSISIFCYALFSYKNLLKSHWLHHQHPASESDPDFHNGRFKNPVAWFLQFMFNYWSWTRLIGLVLVFHTLRGLFHIPVANLNWFWITPAIASSMQLFFFGTYLPHREPKGGYQNSSRAQSTNWSTFWSFISCYHFGYHLEHHEYPNAPWWALPQVHQQRKSKDFQGAL